MILVGKDETALQNKAKDVLSIYEKRNKTLTRLLLDFKR
jgi:hypothetical protein